MGVKKLLIESEETPNFYLLPQENARCNKTEQPCLNQEARREWKSWSFIKDYQWVSHIYSKICWITYMGCIRVSTEVR
jgi:hypothetical protein